MTFTKNILVDDSFKIKLIDFGLAAYRPLSKNPKFLGLCGTRSFCPPEMLKNQEYYGFAGEMWTLGITLFVMIYGRFPMDNEPRSLPNNGSIEVKQSIRGLLDKNVTSRMTMDEVNSIESDCGSC